MERKGAFHLTVAVCILIAALSQTAHAQYGGGSGTADDPYLIYTPEQMNAVGADPNDWNKHFKLMADLDLSAYTGEEFNLIGSVNRRTPGQRSVRTLAGGVGMTSFTGVFDGNDHTITNFTCVRQWRYDIGLFGCVDDPNAQIRNLGLIAPMIDVERYGGAAGSLVGTLRSGSIMNCHVAGGTVRARGDVGGLIGRSEAIVVGCHATAEVDGSESAGGLVGTVSGGAVEACFGAGQVDGRDDVGGLIGCVSSGRVERCFSAALVRGRWDVGGLIGRVESPESGEPGVTRNSYSRSLVVGERRVGGLIGANAGWVEHCYCTHGPSVICDEDRAGLRDEDRGGSIDEDRGGLIGYNSGRVEGCFWDTESSGASESDGGMGLGTEAMKDITVYLAMGWDFVGEVSDDLDDPWTVPEGGGYPVLMGLPHVEADVLPGQPLSSSLFRVSTASELELLASYHLNAHIRLEADIYFSGTTRSEAVIPEFSGVLDGNGFAVHHLVISGDERVGLIGTLHRGARVTNLDVVNSHVTGEREYAGSLVGYSAGRIENCHAVATVVTGETFVGGLVGFSTGTLSDCSSIGTVTGHGNTGGLLGGNHGGCITCCSSISIVAGHYDVGGLLGRNDGNGFVVACSSSSVTEGLYGVGGLIGESGFSWEEGMLTRCHSTGTVSGQSEVGGLVGETGGGWITRCYSSARVAGRGHPEHAGGLLGRNTEAYVSRCFWDLETSGQAFSDGGTGLSTAQMTDVDTYLEAGWDFLGETDNGWRDTWTIAPGNAYPVLTVSQEVGRRALQGEGTSERPYLLSTPQDLGMVLYEPHAHYQLVNDIDLFGVTWSGAVVPEFFGVLNGAGHVVRNPAITGEHDLGLIGTLEMSGRVVDLGLVDANVISDGYCAGVLVGANYGCIARCFSTGAIAGNENVGGLIGRNGIHTAPEDHDALVIDCYSQCQVSGTNYVGGLVGWNYRGDVVHSYSTGRTQQEEVDPSPRGGTNRPAGGLVGYDMGEVLDSYWDIETSGQNASAGGTGLTTAEMMTAAPFLEAGWDFVGEDENGTDDLWWIDEGRGYPRLWWEGDGAEF